MLTGRQYAPWMGTVLPDERRVNVVAEQFLQPLRQVTNHVTRNGQAVVLLWPQPACRVLQDHAESRPGGLIRATAVPEAAQVEQDRAG